tara:strand:- start:9178 stop:9699 length:522 start_codon:yes stop_codon:yes gene_type:complete
VWHPAGVGAPDALMMALVSRQLRVETSGSGHEVLAMGCVEQQKGGAGLIVVLDGRGGELAEQSRVLEAMERFCPSALVWVYEEGANPPLRGFVEKGRAAKGAVHETIQKPVQSPVQKSGVEIARPKLRLSGTGGNGTIGSGTNGSGQMKNASDVLDKDELSALFGSGDAGEQA